jgi:hypothetical protein
VGNKRSGLVHKFACLAHSLRLVTPSLKCLANLANAIVATVTDWGTEKGFAELPAINVYEMLDIREIPTADKVGTEGELDPMRSDDVGLESSAPIAEGYDMDLDIDMDPNFDDTVATGADHEGADTEVRRRQAELDAEADLLFQSSGEDDECNAELNIDASGQREPLASRSVDACAPAAASDEKFPTPLEQGVGDYFMDWAIAVMGVLHAIHNACSDMCDSLVHYKEWFYPKFRALIVFMDKQYRRDLLVGQCFADIQLHGRHR